VIRPRLLNWCKENGYDLYESGLKIYTTIDSRLQKKAEEAMAKRMRLLQAEFERQWAAKGSEPWVDEGGYEYRFTNNSLNVIKIIPTQSKLC
jgi:penicillin-binding protein 1A